MFSSLHTLASADVQIEGDLLHRLQLNYNRLEREEYEPQRVYAQTANNLQWPGDTPGRTILALAKLARVTRRQPKYLEALMRELPNHFNERGYMGEATSLFDEQQLSSHGWLVAGVIEYANLTGDQAALQMAGGMVRNLFLPLRGQFHTYPCRPEERVVNEADPSGTRGATLRNWVLSTDIGCAFIGLEGLVPWYEHSRDEQVGALIEEMFEVFRGIDFVGTSLQLHASLTGARNFLRFHDLSGDARLVETARHVYGLFRDQAMTENYANYNWFNRPWWTEPCAVVDAFILAVELWRKTNETSYLEDAQHIYFNALGYAQKPHGGFGCDSCVGAEGEDNALLQNKVYDVTWCCNMRGAVGLAAAVEYSILQNEEAVVLPFFFDQTSHLHWNNGTITLRQETAYPTQGRVRLYVESSSLGTAKTVAFFLPSWVPRATVRLVVNGQNLESDEQNGFVALRHTFAAGDILELSFTIELRQEIALSTKAADSQTFRHGPLLLGSPADAAVELSTLRLVEGDGAHYRDGEDGSEVLAPLNNVLSLSSEVAEKERRRLLFSA